MIGLTAFSAFERAVIELNFQASDMHRSVPADHFPKSIRRAARVTGTCVQDTCYPVLPKMPVERLRSKSDLPFVYQLGISLPR